MFETFTRARIDHAGSTTQAGQLMDACIRDTYEYMFGTTSTALNSRRVAQIEQEFLTLKTLWKLESSGHSAMQIAAKSPYYKRIISLGSDVVPFLLKDMKEHGTHWFIALGTITGYNPIQIQHRGRIRLMIDDWYDWGRSKNLIE